MRRVVGAAIVILALGGSKMAAWMTTRHPTMPADSTFGAFASPHVDEATVANASTRVPRDSFSLSYVRDPLRFLSTAPADSLQLLPGVGPVLATRLLDARRGLGSFRSWDDVDRVRGIGPKTIERLKSAAVRR
jgi:predicted flap endonuclease-1-like 5' DNA nuclease